jgi:hypothetical protein
MRRVCLALWYRALVAGAAIVFGSTAFVAAAATTAAPAPAPAPAAEAEADPLVTELATCLSADDREVVFFPDKKFECVPRRSGGRLLAAITPQQRDPLVICGSEHAKDQRRLRLKTIIKLAKQQAIKIGADGIRLIGAVFCSEEVNLNDLVLPYSLVLDHGVFRYGIRAVGFSTRDNFSVDDSYVFGNLRLRNAKIEGSLSARRSFIVKARIIDTEVGGQTILEDSLFHGVVTLEHFVTKGAVRFKNAAFPALEILNSTIRARLDLEKTEARCHYLIRGGQIDDIYAYDLGLGAMSIEPSTVAGPGVTADSMKRYEWNRAVKQQHYAQYVQNGWASQLIAEHDCIDKPDLLSRFQVTGVEARTFCLQDFQWQTSKSHPSEVKSEIKLTDLTVSGNAIVNLWPLQANDADVSKDSRVLRMHGVSARVLYFDFSDRDRPHTRSIDRLSVDRIHTTADTSCGSTAREDRSNLPNPEDVKIWLRNNTSLSLQPFVAIIKAYENSGASSTALKVAKADIEYERTQTAWWNQFQAAWHRGTLGSEAVHLMIDYLQNTVTWVTGCIAGYGFRPGQVVWYVAAAVALFWLLFWLPPLGIVAFMPDKKNTLRVVGFLFIFDRLFPLYRIRDDNYNIAQYFKRGTGPDQQSFRYFWRSITCIPATNSQARWAARWIDVLRAVGIVLAIFLVAAINALVAK